MSRAATLVMFLLLHAVALAGDHVLEGVVRDIEGRPVPGATVQVGDRYDADLQQRVVADESGRYRFEGLSGGLTELRVAPPGQPCMHRASRIRVASTPHFDPVVMPGHAVRGRVTDDSTGEPLAGARVVVRGDGYWGAFVALATAGEDGTYELTTPGRGFRLYARASMDGWAMAGDEPSLVPGVDDELVFDIALQPRPVGTIQGFVRDAAGEPLADVEVLATNLRRSADRTRSLTELGVKDPGYWSVRTEADGRYELEKIDAGVVTLIARAPGLYVEGEDGRFFVSQSSGEVPGPFHVTVPSDDDVVRDVVLREKTVLTGTVVDEYGIPVAGATVAVPANVAPLDVAKTDDRGVWVLPVAPGHDVRVIAHAPEHGHATVTIDVGATPPDPLQFTIARYRRVDVHVRTPDGAAPVGARCGYGNPQYANPYFHGEYASQVELDERGDGELVTRPDFQPIIAFATAPGYAAAVSETLEPNIDEVTIVLSQAHDLKGRVVGTANGPLAGVRITVNPHGGAWSGHTPDPHAFVTGVWAVTDADGEFVVRDLPAGQHGVLATGPLLWGAGQHVTLPSTDELVLRPERAYTLSGVVVDDAGEPVPGVRLDVSGAPSQIVQPFTDARGRFHLEWLRAGAHVLTAEAPSDSYATTRLADIQGGVDDLRVVLLRRHPVVGRVVTDAGDPLRRVRVVLSLVTQRSVRLQEETATDEDGRFAFGRQDPADYVISVLPRRDGWAAVHRRLRPAADETYVMRSVQGERIVGVLLDGDGQPAAGRELAGRVIDLPPEVPGWVSDERLSVTTADNGSFAFEGLSPGRLMVSLAPVDDPEGDFLLADGGEVEIPTGSDDVTLSGAWGATIEGLVVDDDGNGIAGVKAWLRVGTGDRATLTDGGGAFRLGNLPDEVLRGAPSFQLDGWQVVRVTPRRGSDGEPFRVTMARAVTVTGSLVDAEGNPLADWQIELRHDEHPWRRNVRTSKTGRFRVTNAPEGVLIGQARGPDSPELLPCGRFSTNVEDPLLRLGDE